MFQEYINEDIIAIIAQVLLIAGALNWGAIAFNGMDLVKAVAGAGLIDRGIKFLVAIAGIYASYALYKKFTQKE
jgi:uncharacterized membrane protein YuzA (DUF378 family)